MHHDVQFFWWNDIDKTVLPLDINDGERSDPCECEFDAKNHAEIARDAINEMINRYGRQSCVVFATVLSLITVLLDMFNSNFNQLGFPVLAVHSEFPKIVVSSKKLYICVCSNAGFQSVTFPGAAYFIDFGLNRSYGGFDPAHVSKLHDTWCDGTVMKQKMGCADREPQLP
uniref:Uncharacterized protein n=1 Tax=Panagrolaimus sp. ES5 TaxID=591445 RepID=A0AC34FZF8_9BILA